MMNAKETWVLGHLRTKCCLFLRVGFTIQYLDKFFLLLHLSALLLC